MSYVTSSQDFWLENGHILHAKCKDSNGDLQDSSLDLNQFIGNSDGWFIWDGENFSHSASDISLDGSRLTAQLNMVGDGQRERQGIDLNDRIGNNNGQLTYNRQDE